MGLISVRVSIDAEEVAGTDDMLCVHGALDELDAWVVTHRPTGLRLFNRAYTSKVSAMSAASLFWERLSPSQKDVWKSDDPIAIRSTRPIDALQEAAAETVASRSSSAINPGEMIPWKPPVTVSAVTERPADA